MLRKIFLFGVALLSFSCIAFAETSAIKYEVNAGDTITYSVHETTASTYGRLGKAFYKHINSDGTNHYWIRIALGDYNVLLPEMKLIVDGKSYLCLESESPKKYQIASMTRMIMFADHDGAVNYYDLPGEAVEALKNCNTVTMVYGTQKREETSDKPWNSGMIKKTKEILSLTKNDKEKFHRG